MNDQAHDFVLLEDDYLAAAYELQDIASTKKLLKERQAECKRILEKVLTVGERGVSPDGDELVYVRRGARMFRAGLATTNLDKDLLSQILTLQPDANIAKDILPDSLYDECCVYNKASVVAL
jgi:hypothetical protein